jgi:hypothetical protein
VFIDQSGSTDSQSTYWDGVMSIISEYGPESRFVLWNTDVKSSSYGHAYQNALQRSGDGGTQPQCFANLAEEGSRIVIVTDGEVDQSDVVACDNILRSRAFKSVHVHFFSTWGKINLSVSAPFTRKTDYFIHKNGECIASGSTKDAISIDCYFDNPTKFLAEAEALYRQIAMANMGLKNERLRGELLALQKNLMRCISENNDPGIARTTSNPFKRLCSPRTSRRAVG